MPTSMLADDPLWYQDAIIYEVHVRAFHDSVGDGMGDFRGLTQKLDYLQDLGVTAIWLLPFYPSPLKDDGYDIADYCGIHPDYGSIDDFRHLLDEAHARGLRVITELVLNHTSDQHPWFQRARRAQPGSSLRDFYVWSDTPDKYRDARIIFKDFETSNWTWDPVARAYFWHRFYSHQPDLNYDNPDVWQAMFPVVDFWFEMGVDGMRLDAVPYLFEREGTSSENLPQTHDFLRALRKHVDQRFPNRMLLAEANQWPEDAVAYFGQGDECHMCFHFPLMPRMFMAIHMEDRFPIVDIMEQTPPIAPTCQWGLFLRNHDELTLEMVTDEERDYMYRAYAHDPQARINFGIRRRLAPLLGNNRRRIELMNALLFSLKGTPVLYYGEEIGMGDNIYLGDRNGVRTPMQWSSDRNAGFSRANPQKLYLPIIIDPEYHYEATNVEAQQSNPNSLLWWMKRLIALRKWHRAFGRGSLQFLSPKNRKILAFLRRFEDECILVVVNLSRFVQYVELDLSEFVGLIPIEVFGRNAFPPVSKQPYTLTLGPHAFYWFSLEPAARKTSSDPPGVLTQPAPFLYMRGSWEDLFRVSQKSELEAILPAYLPPRRWFGSKARTIKSVSLREAFRVPYGRTFAYVTLIQAEFLEGAAESYLLPLTYASPEKAQELATSYPHAIVARLQGRVDGALIDALADPSFCTAIIEAIETNQSFEGENRARIRARALPRLAEVRAAAETPLTPSIGKAEQTNTSIRFGNQMILKAYRRVEEGINPDLEVGNHLTYRAPFAHTAPVLGTVEYRRGRRFEPMVLALLQAYVPNQGDAWHYTLDTLSQFFETVLAGHSTDGPPNLAAIHLVDLADSAIPEQALELIGTYVESARLLGQRTAEMHLALATPTDDPHFSVETFTPHYQRSLYQSLRNLYGRVFEQLRHGLPELHEGARPLADRVLEQSPRIMHHFYSLLGRKLTATRTRCHGDYHLGQILFTGKDFFIIDFEGEPDRSIGERRLKRSPLKDVAGMVRSFHYAAHSGYTERGQMPGVIRPEDIAVLETWATFWYHSVSAIFLKAYSQTAGGSAFLPATADEIKFLLDLFLLEKAVYELGYELNHRPDWVRIPLMGILQLIG